MRGLSDLTESSAGSGLEQKGESAADGHMGIYDEAAEEGPNESSNQELEDSNQELEGSEMRHALIRRCTLGEGLEEEWQDDQQLDLQQLEHPERSKSTVVDRTVVRACGTVPGVPNSRALLIGQTIEQQPLSDEESPTGWDSWNGPASPNDAMIRRSIPGMDDMMCMSQHKEELWRAGTFSSDENDESVVDTDVATAHRAFAAKRVTCARPMSACSRPSRQRQLQEVARPVSARYTPDPIGVQLAVQPLPR